MMSFLKFLLISSLLYLSLSTGDINKHIVLDKFQQYIENSNFDGSTFMQIEELVDSSVEKYFQNAVEPPSTGNRARFLADLFSNSLEVAAGCSGDTIQASSSIEVTNMLNTTFFNTQKLKLNELFVGSLYNPHSPIILRGNFKMTAIKTSQPIEAASFMVKDVQQWTLFKHEAFHENEKVEGWSLAQVSSCEGSQLKSGFLGGPCVLNTDLTKKLENLPRHNKLRIKATVHLFDNWEGETLLLQMDGGKTIWSKKGVINKKFQTPNRCGNPEYGDPLMNINIDKIINHDDSFLSLRFSTNMHKDSCKASYAVEDFSVYLQ